LKDERWITPHETLAPRCHDWIKELLRSAQCNAKFGKTANSLQGMLALVAADEGICLVGKQLLVNSTTGIRLVPTDCPNFELFAVSLKNPSSIPAASYMEVLREDRLNGQFRFALPRN
jgi:DNA-binding transcriptional LysR family regulator